MPSKLKRLNAAKTYIILDTQVLPYAKLLSVLKSMVHAGVGLVQLRDKNGTARDMLSFCQAAQKITGEKTLFIVNDRIDVALLAKSDGVHLGQEDIPMKQALMLTKGKMLVGISCQNLLHARRAQAEGADYIGFGSIFKTKTKPDRLPMNLNLLQKVHKQIKIPIFPIGGINRENIKSLLSYGVKRAAVCREALEAKQPGKVIKDLHNILEY